MAEVATVTPIGVATLSAADLRDLVQEIYRDHDDWLVGIFVRWTSDRAPAEGLAHCPWPWQSPRWWPGEVPVRGHEKSPLVAIEGPHLALKMTVVPLPAGEGVAADTITAGREGSDIEDREGAIGHHHDL